ncbi:Aldehyde/histidinol dehydrogenase [Xylariales sp. AK1849]|nr:Aldehyde/histidinol dehydrogenase [Xylariales sp. AK1849]
MTEFTPTGDFERIHKTLHETFKSGRTKSISWRKWQLKQIWWMIEENQQKISDALIEDLNRHPFEAYALDIYGMKLDILEHISKVEEWTRDEHLAEAGLIMGRLGKARIHREPLGVALVIGAWNFPFLLLIQPLLAAVAAGCCVLMKPSELSLASQNLLQTLVPQYLDPSAIALVTGGPAETAVILERKFDHIFFTGSGKIARHITAAAAKHLTPTVLELGGQGPAIVTESADVHMAAKRVAFAKYLNAGQICLSVNHVFVHPSIHDQFLTSLAYWNEQFQLGEKDADFVNIVNERNFDRLAGLLKRSKGTITSGGQTDRNRLIIRPTVVANVTLGDALMEDELFGPICPVLKATTEEAYNAIKSSPHPLAIYIFSNNQQEIDEILHNTNSGGVTINDVIMHASVHEAPFGGVGESGYGYYHGKHGFDCFSHKRIIVAPPTWLERLMAVRYPPFNVKNIDKMKVTNNIGFKKGETMEDQRIGKHRSKAVPVTIAAAVLFVLAAWYDRTLLSGVEEFVSSRR